MTALFLRLILRPLSGEKLRTALMVLAVTLGVAVVVAIDLASEAATGSFRASMESLTGDSELEITATGGVDEKLYARLATMPVPLRWTPRLEGFAEVAATSEVRTPERSGGAAVLKVLSGPVVVPLPFVATTR